MVLHRLTQYIKGNLFVIAAGNEDDLFGEGNGDRQWCGSGWRQWNRCNTGRRAEYGPIQSGAHAGEGLCRVKDHIVGDQPLYGGDGGQIVFHIVFSGNQNPVCGEERPFFFPFCATTMVPLSTKTPSSKEVRRLNCGDPSRRPADHGVGQVIVPVEDGQVIFSLMGEDVLLCQGIFFHGLMNIQMVGGQIGKTAISGLAESVISWKEESSKTAISSGDMLPASERSGFPIFLPDGRYSRHSSAFRR